MPRLLGVDIPDKKRVEYALAYLFGVGLTRAQTTVAQCKIDPAKKAGDLTPDEIRHITAFIQEHYRVEGDLRREVSQNIRRLISIGSYRGTRHKRGLPVRGLVRAGDTDSICCAVRHVLAGKTPHRIFEQEMAMASIGG